MNPRLKVLLHALLEMGQAALLALLTKALRGLRAALQGTWELVSTSRLYTLLATGLLVCALAAGIQLLPALYGRLSLAHEASIAAQQSLRAGEGRVIFNLKRAALKQGFPEAVLQPGIFRLEYSQEDGIQECAVSYDFIHVVQLFGLAKLPVRIRVRHRVLRPVAEPLPTDTVELPPQD